jgi:hypothetical protein
MKCTAILLVAALAVSIAIAGETKSLTAVVRGKPLEFTPELTARVVQKSLDLLSSCAYMDSDPKWGAPGNPQSMADAQKDSHLRLIFSTPRKVEVPAEKVSVAVGEIVISIPFAAGGIWVRTDRSITYFAKFNCETAQELQKLFDHAQTP